MNHRLEVKKHDAFEPMKLMIVVLVDGDEEKASCGAARLSQSEGQLDTLANFFLRSNARNNSGY